MARFFTFPSLSTKSSAPYLWDSLFLLVNIALKYLPPSLAPKKLFNPMKKLLLLNLMLCFSVAALAQMWNGVDTLYGNEWIDFDKTYLKFKVAEDGIYRVDANLLNQYIPAGTTADQLALFFRGAEVAIFTSTSGTLGSDDFIEFFGQRNRTELDGYLFEDPEEHFHPDYSLFSDTSAYFLTWTSGTNNKRFAQINNDLSNPPPKEEFFMYDYIHANGFSSYTKKSVTVGNAEVQQSFYDDTEGWCTGFGGGTLRTFNINLKEIYYEGPDATCTVQFACRQGNHQQVVRLNEVQYVEDIFTGYFGRKHSFTVPIGQLTNPSTVEFEGLYSSSDKQAVSNIHIRYPRTFHFGGENAFVFTIEGNGSTQYIEVPAFNSGANVPRLYDITNQYRLEMVKEGGISKAVLPPANGPRTLVMVNVVAGISTIEAAKVVNFIDYEAQDAQFVLLYHKFFTQSADGTNWVQEYADYRAFESPHPLSTITVDVEQLYDQFAYGVDYHPISIRNFAHYVDKEWEDIRYFFIIGKGREYRHVRKGDDLANAINVNFFVPTFGVPGADNLLFSPNNDPVPIAPVGRLAAVSAQEVKLYLDKVKQYENADFSNQSIADQAWTKRIVHLAGGGDAIEQQLIRGHMEGMRSIIENNTFGGKVTSFFKTSTDPVETSQTSQIKDLINDGVAILSFFGHSSPNIFDFNFDDPASYENIGKYPILLSMGCFSGQCHTDGIGIGERFIKAQDRGAIIYLASTGYGFISALDVFGDKLYSNIGGPYYGASVGDLVRATLAEMALSSIVGERELAQQTTLQGDPSLILYAHPGPDYLVDNRSVTFDPGLLNTQLEDFDFRFKVANIGRNLPDTIFHIEIDQQLPNGERVNLVNEAISAPAFEEELAFTIPIIGPAAVGFNRFFVKVDAQDEIDELPSGAELNNELVDGNNAPGIGVYIVSNDVQPITPAPYSIVNEPNVELIASTLNAAAGQQGYRMELDTSRQFNSPVKQSEGFDQIGGLLKWRPAISLQPNTVYYWRVSPDSLNSATGFRWQYSSFVYLPNSSPGWNQSHFFQLSDNDFVNTQLLASTRKLSFIDDIVDIKVRNCILDYPAKIPRYYRRNISQMEYEGSPMTDAVPAGLLIAVLDTVDILPWVTESGGAYGVDLPWQGLKGFLFRTDNTNERQEVIDFLENVVPDDYYVLLLTVQSEEDADYQPQAWAADSTSLNTNLFQVLEAQGAMQVRQLEQMGSRPYSLIYKKNDPNFTTQELIGTLEDFSEVNADMPGNWISGTVRSTTIGPSSTWENLEWSYSDFDPALDSVSLSIFAVTNEGTDSLMMTGLTDVSLELNTVDAEVYPFIRLEYFSEDEIEKTASNLDYWRVRYIGLPEAAINPAGRFSLYNDTLFQGEQLKLEVGVENISRYDMDSMLVRFSLIGPANENLVFNQRLRPLPAGDTLIAQLQVDTRTLAGNYSLSVDVNPDEDQPEETHINNVAVYTIYIRKDDRNPLLDVTFDGTHIMDGDLVAPDPTILVSLEDDNPYLAIADTTLFRMLFQYPDGSTHPIYFAQDYVQFYPAGNPQNGNRAAIEIQPHFEQDGMYQLFIEATDASGNEIGDLNYVANSTSFGFDYRTSFEVITKSMISNVLNYPNPFSTSTRFVYTLTGSEPPAFFKIQIMTVSGRIVRELTQTDLGMLRTGTHQTDFAWDGTDQFGDPLANGVYLYRVVAQKANGEDFEQYDNGTNAFFNKGFGKLVIVR